MLLRASGEHDGTPQDLRNILAEELQASAVPQAGLLIGYADAFVAGDAATLAGLGGEIETALGPAALVDCAGVVAIFSAVVRIADATGIPLEDYKAEISADFRDTLGIDRFRPEEA